jgi:hypothetical protein
VPNAEKNVINAVSEEFKVDSDRTLSIVSVNGTKIVELTSNSDFNNLSS